MEREREERDWRWAWAPSTLPPLRTPQPVHLRRPTQQGQLQIGGKDKDGKGDEPSFPCDPTSNETLETSSASVRSCSTFENDQRLAWVFEANEEEERAAHHVINRNLEF